MASAATAAATVSQPPSIAIDITAPQPVHKPPYATTPPTKENLPPDPPSGEECPICFETFDDSPTFRCGHSVCGACLTSYLSYRVLSEDEAFPACPLPYCSAVFPNAILRRYLDPAVVTHVWEMQSQQQARSIDGAKLFCYSCDNLPLPPPAPISGHVAPVTTCASCDAQVCVQCGLSAHIGSKCKVSLACKQFDVPTSLYLMYAVGRVGICPECSTHVERNGGCQVVTCRCGHEFNFRPFKSMQDVAISLENHKKTPYGFIVAAFAVCTLLLALSVALFFVLPTKMATIVAMSIILIVICIACFCCGVRWT